jgi:hypothetical protein
MTSSKTRSPQRTPRCIRDGAPRSSPASCVRVLLHHLWGPSRYRRTKRARVPALSRVAPARSVRFRGAGFDWEAGRGRRVVRVSRGYLYPTEILFTDS